MNMSYSVNLTSNYGRCINWRDEFLHQVLCQ
uniref:Uncharacterized protein n=1 Tax=Lepeophtheirus salmonis TaxID=72036 RepID=A0A0K2UV41_LEPSM